MVSGWVWVRLLEASCATWDSSGLVLEVVELQPTGPAYSTKFLELSRRLLKAEGNAEAYDPQTFKAKIQTSSGARDSMQHCLC